MVLFRTFVMLIWILTAAAVQAADGGEEEAPVVADQEELRYVPLGPSFVANFGASDNGRLQFVRANVSLRATGAEAAAAINYHLPALRNALVMLLSRQDEGSVSTGAGREAIRAEALAELQAILEAEEGEPYIEEVLFTDFIVQR